MVVVTAGAKQHPGQSRLELAAVNVKIAQTLTEQLLAVSPDAVLLFVTNPGRRGDLRSYPGCGTVVPRPNFRIWDRAGHGPIAIPAGYRTRSRGGRTFMPSSWASTGDSEIPLWSSATIGGVPATSFVGPSGGVLGPDLRAKVAKSVVESAYEIIEGKGATNLAIGLSSAFIAEVVLRDEQRVLPVSTLQSGVHGLEHVCLSLPHDGWSCWCRPSPRSTAIGKRGFGAPIFCPDIARGAGISGIVNICSPRYPTYRINK